MKKKQCSARNCDEIIKREKVFCIMHWTFLPNDIQDELVRHYVSGQYKNKSLATKQFRVSLEKARAILFEEENRYD